MGAMISNRHRIGGARSQKLGREAKLEAEQAIDGRRTRLELQGFDRVMQDRCAPLEGLLFVGIQL